MTIAVKVLQAEHRAILVMPGEDREAAAWLDRGAIEIGEQRLDGSTLIRAPQSLVEIRGLSGAIERRG